MNHVLIRADQSQTSAKNESWGSLTWLAGQSVSGTQELTLGRVVILRGQSNPRHSHSNCLEALYLLHGRLEHQVGDQTVTLEAGDTLIVPAGCPHCARSIGQEDADMIVVYSSGQRNFKLESEA